MTQERLAKQVMLAAPTRKHTSGCPRTRWRDYISNLFWYHLVEPDDLPETPENREVYRVLLGCCLRDPSKRKSKYENKWMNLSTINQNPDVNLTPELNISFTKFCIIHQIYFVCLISGDCFLKSVFQQWELQLRSKLRASHSYIGIRDTLFLQANSFHSG